MILTYNDKYFDELKTKIKDFDIAYLKKEDVFNKNYIYLVNNKPIGLISFSVIYERIELNYIWVEETYRNNGIASKMIEFMFKTKNIVNISLEVRTDNTKAINLYQKFGFKIVAKREKYYGQTDAYLMMKEMI